MPLLVDYIVKAESVDVDDYSRASEDWLEQQVMLLICMHLNVGVFTDGL